MPKLSPEMREKILEEYKRNHVYKAVAEKLGLDERTVKKVVDDDRTMTKTKSATVVPDAKTESIARGKGDAVFRQKAKDQTSTTPILSSEEQLKIIYTEFKEGKLPFDIIASHGYEPEFVESEYRRFLKQKLRSSGLPGKYPRIL